MLPHGKYTHMNTPIRLLLLAAAMVALVLAFLLERRTVCSLADGQEKNIGGAAFVEAASYDGLLRKDGKLFDNYSLTPPNLQAKDCAT